MGNPAPTPVSSLPGIAWPAMPGPKAAGLLALLYQFDQSQWWTPEQIAQCQFHQAAAVVSHAYQYVPFYRRKFQQSSIDPFAGDMRSQWSQVPITTRQELQDAGETARSPAVPMEHGAIRKSLTSGSTGRPLVSYSTDLCGQLWSALTIREHLWHQRDMQGTLAFVRAQPPSFARGGVRLPNWGPPTSEVFATGPAAALNVREDIEAQWRWLSEINPHYLLTHPTNLRALADHAKERGQRLPQLREVRTVGEMVTADLREHCLQALGASLVDIYSAQETGYLALQCPHSEGYHIQSESVLVEVLDERNEPCAPGGIGRLVITSLVNFAMPLIRYEILDYAEVGEPCPCGRGLPRLRRIVGRQRNMLRLPDGRRCWPVFSPKAYLSIAPVRQLQVVQHEVDRIEARIVIAEPMSEVKRQEFVAYLRRNMGFDCAVELTQVDSIKPAASGKFDDFVSHVT